MLHQRGRQLILWLPQRQHPLVEGSDLEENALYSGTLSPATHDVYIYAFTMIQGLA